MNDNPRASDQRPWPGLNAFTELLQAFFHGRKSETDELFRRVTRGPLTVLFGQSGLGKTSLIQAGLFPRLRYEGYLPVVVRLDYSAGAQPFTQQVIAELSNAFTVAELGSMPPISPGETLWEYFHRRGNVLSGYNDETTNVVLVFDQFEEIFTLGEISANDRIRKADFLTEIADLVENRLPSRLVERCEQEEQLIDRYCYDRDQLRIVFSLREDYLPELESLKIRMPAVAENRMRLTRMNGQQALDAVLLPAGRIISDKVGRRIVHFIAGGFVNGEEDNEQEMVEAAGIEIEPALLSLFCHELNDRRIELGMSEITVDLLEGNRAQIIDRFYERCLGDQSPIVRRFVEDELLTDSGHRIPIALERAQKTIVERGGSRSAIEALIRRRLLHIEQLRHVPFVELTHDLLIDVVKKSRGIRERKEIRKAARRRIYFPAIAIGLLFIIVAAELYVTSLHKETELNARIREEHRKSRELEQGRYSIDMPRAQQYIDRGDIGKAIPLLQRHLPDSKGPDLRDFVWRHLCWRCVGDSVATFRDRMGPYCFHGVAFSPDRQTLATSGEDGLVLIHDVSRLDRAPIALEKIHQSVQMVAFSPDGGYLACATGSWRTTKEDCKVYLWSIVKKQFVATLADENNPDRAKRLKAINTVAFSSDGKLLATASEDNQVRVWKLDFNKNELIAKLPGFDKGANDLAFAAGKYILAVGWGDGHLQIWDLEKETPIKQFEDVPPEVNSGITALAFAPDGQTIVMAVRDGAVRYWDVANREFSFSVESRQGVIELLRFSPDGKQFLTAGNNGTIVLWDFAARQPSYRFVGHRDIVYSVAFAPDGQQFASASGDGTVKLWKIDYRREVPFLREEGVVEDLSFSPNGELLATAARSAGGTEHGGHVSLWDVRFRNRKAVLATQATNVNSISFSPDGNVLASGGADQGVDLWDVVNKKKKGRLASDEKSTFTAVAFLPDKDRHTLAAANRLGNIMLWSMDTTGTWTSYPVGKHTNVVAAVAFSPDGSLLASASHDWTVGMWDVATRKSLATLYEHRGPCYAVRFSHKTMLLASGGHDRTVRIWNTSDHKFDPAGANVLSDSESSIKALAFSHDDVILAGTSQDSAVVLWHVVTGNELAVLRSHSGGVLCADFSPDGNTLATGGNDRTVRLWQTAKPEEIHSLFNPSMGWSEP